MPADELVSDTYLWDMPGSYDALPCFVYSGDVGVKFCAFFKFNYSCKCSQNAA